MRRMRVQGAVAVRAFASRRQTGRAAAAVAGALVLVGGLAALWALRTGEPDTAAGTAPDGISLAPTPVIIYLVDTLRADRLHLYGYPKATSPVLDALAADSVVFDQAYAPAPWTMASVASLVTSTFTCEHGVVHAGLALDPALRTLAERLKDQGFATAAYYSNIIAGPAAGLDRGYQVSEYINEMDPHDDDAKVFLDGVGSAPFYLYLHTMEPHDSFLTEYPYTRHFGHVSVEQRAKFEEDWHRYTELKNADFRGKRPVGTTDNTVEQQQLMAGFREMSAGIATLYDGAVLRADEALGSVIALLKDRGVWDRSLFIVIADHGEEFGEHDTWFHEQSVYEAAMRVPLLVHFPGGEFGGRRVSRPVSLVDIAPTIFDYLGRPELCDGCRGASLLPLARGDVSGRVGDGFVPALRLNRSTYYRPSKERRGDINVMIRRDQWKAIWNQEPDSLELYDLSADPGEQRDVSAGRPEIAGELRAAATGWFGDCSAALQAPQPVELDVRTREKLRALGYAN